MAVALEQFVKYLTKFQAQEIYLGRAKSLILGNSASFRCSFIFAQLIVSQALRDEYA
jgi:hypothetical protein